MSKTYKELEEEFKNQYHFGDPQEVEQALETNKELAKNFASIPIGDSSKLFGNETLDESDIEDIPRFEDFVPREPITEPVDLGYRDRYYALMDIVSDLIEELKLLKGLK